MKKLALALSLFTLLSAHSCNENAGGMTSLLDKKWVFQSLNGEKLAMPDGVETPWVQLASDQLTGFGGCNRLMGSYKLGDGSISFPGLGGTKMYCEATQATERKVQEALRGADSYKMEGGLLKLLRGGAEVASLKAE